MEGIDFRSNRYEVIEQIAKVLHDPSVFKPGRFGRPINFLVRLNPGKSGILHDGTGTLTVPEENIGITFINLIRKKKATVETCGRKVFFERTIKLPSRFIVHQLKMVPFQDPKIEQEREQKNFQLRRRLRVNRLQFGVWLRRPGPECRGTFAAEWDRSYTNKGNALIWIEYDHKLARIQIGDCLQDELAYSIVIKFTNMRNVWIGHDFGNPCKQHHILYSPIPRSSFSTQSSRSIYTFHLYLSASRLTDVVTRMSARTRPNIDSALGPLIPSTLRFRPMPINSVCYYTKAKI